MEEQRLGREHTIWLAVIFEGGLFLVAMGVAWLFELPLPNQVRWDWRHALWAVVATLPLLVAMTWTQDSRLGPLRRLREVVDELIVPIFRECTLLDFALISLLAGVGEEALFRGVIQTPLANHVHPIAAAVIAGVLFGVVHWITTAYAVLAAVIGIYLGVLLLYFDNLLVPILVHGLYDFVALVYLVRTAKPGVRGQGSGDRGQGSGNRDQESGEEN